MATKKILFISYDGMTDPLGQSQVIPYLKGLTKQGYEFIILSCEKPEKLDGNKDYVASLLTGYPIKWVYIKYHKNPPVLSSVYDFLQLKKKAVALHQQEKFDLVHTRVGVPQLLGLWIKKNLRIKFLNDIRGFWADERVDGGQWNIKNPIYNIIYKFFRKKENEFIIHADYNTCLTYAAAKEIHTWKQIPNQPIPLEVIPCCVDMNLFDPNNIDASLKNKFKEELKIKDGDFIITYLGSIGGWYLIEEMMRFCKILGDKIPHAKFLFISPHNHYMVAAAASKYGLSTDKLIVKQGKRYEVPALLSFSTYSVFFIKPCYSKISSSPTKHGEIMAMGIPVITNAGVGDVKEILTDYHSGYLVNDFTDASFNSVVDKIVSSNPFDKETIRNGAKEFYSLETAVQRYSNVYAKIFAE
ncbi:glycosyltransferase [Ferruginibacter albus]|uniref:glycosyltransferase n=1 Tax=Ferruginibacter albus TaxID=2875540 RepID=UPI001CC5FB93|nr:glycosyltransferase [Ferruginibacter albus]UAY52226.1 glycosyltransferase [Ferruginibacter albus]